MSRRSSHDLRHAAAAWLDDLKAPIPQTREVRVCERIEPEPTDGSIVVTGLEERYRHLLRVLPLGGAAAMREGADGELLPTRRLLDAAPWLERPIRLIDRQLQVQLWAGRPWIRFRPMLLVGPPVAARATWPGSSPRRADLATPRSISAGSATAGRSRAPRAAV